MNLKKKNNHSIIRQKADITERVKKKSGPKSEFKCTLLFGIRKKIQQKDWWVARRQGDNEDILKSRRAWLKRVFIYLLLLRTQYHRLDTLQANEVCVSHRLEAGSPKAVTLALWWTGSQRCKCTAEEDTALPDGKPESNWWGGVKLQGLRTHSSESLTKGF